MTIAFGQNSASLGGTTVLTGGVAFPTGTNVGDLIFLPVINKYSPNAPVTPAGFALLGSSQGGAGASGSDSGQAVLSIYVREADGTETGTTAVSIPSGNSSLGYASRYSKAGNREWSVAIAFGASSTPGLSWSSVAASDPGILPGDMLVCIAGINGDAAGASAAWSAEAIAAAGVTFGTVTERGERSTTQGDDCASFQADALATAGASTGAPTLTATAAATAGNCPAGVTAFIRLREVDPTGQADGVGGASAVGASTAVATGLAAGVGAAFAAGASTGSAIGATDFFGLMPWGGIGLDAVTGIPIGSQPVIPTDLCEHEVITKALDRLVLQLRGQPNVELLLTVLVEPIQRLEDAICQVLYQRGLLAPTTPPFEVAEGAQVDNLGRIVGQRDRMGLSDEDYLRYISARILVNRSSGTLEEMIQILRLLLDDPSISIAMRVQRVATWEVEPTDTIIAPSDADFLIRFIRGAVSGGVRLILRFHPVDEAVLFRFNVGPGFGVGFFAGARSNDPEGV